MANGLSYAGGSGAGTALGGSGTASSKNLASSAYGVDRSKPVSKTKRGINYSATDNTLLLDITKTTTEGSVQSGDIKALNVKNTGQIPAFIMLAYKFWSNATTQDSADQYFINYLIKPGEELFLPTIRGVISDAGIEPLAGTVVTDAVPYGTAEGHLEIDSGDNVASGELNNTTDPVVFELDNDHEKYRVGDLLRCENEILRVEGTYDDNPTTSTVADGHIVVSRGHHGSTAASHSGTPDIMFAMFNAYHNYNKFAVVQTDSQGRFKSTVIPAATPSLAEIARVADSYLAGIVPGSFVCQFYEAGYQELGLSGISATTNTGLATSTSYEFDITVDGGTTFDNLSFTTDSSNVNFGGTNGVLSKIQDALDTQFYTAGNLFEKKVHVGIVGGDIRFTSGSHLAASAIALGAGSSGTAEFFGTGRIPAAPAAATAVAARFENVETYDPVTYAKGYRNDLLVYDNGNGRLFGKASGTINYETGAINMVGCPPNAQFRLSYVHTSAFSGRQDATLATKMNSIQAVYANIPSQKWAGEIEIETF